MTFIFKYNYIFSMKSQLYKWQKKFWSKHAVTEASLIYIM